MQIIAQVVVALCISIIWLLVWNHSFYIDKSVLLSRKKQKNPVETKNLVEIGRVLLYDKRLVFYSSTLIAFITLFYTVIYVGIFFSLLNFHIEYNLNTIGLIVGVVIGGMLIVSSRDRLNMLTSKEVIFSLNEQYSTAGVYKYMRHPMYVGIVTVLVCSLGIFPSSVGFYLLVPICICLYMKMRIEKRN